MTGSGRGGRWAWAVLMAAGAVLVAGRVLVFDLVSLAGDSMLPGFAAGELLLVSRRSRPEPGDVVVVRLAGEGERYVKRVAAGPGQVVEVTSGELRVDGQPARLDQPVADPGWTCLVQEAGLHGEQLGRQRLAVVSDRVSAAAISLGPDEWFLIGDNRPSSFDSRQWGALSAGELSGVVVAVLPGRDPCDEGLHWGRRSRTVE